MSLHGQSLQSLLTRATLNVRSALTYPGLVLTDRTSILSEILKIEAQIKMMRRDPVYAKIMHNLDKLEKRRFGSVTVNVPSPDDPEKVVEVRCNSPEMREIISKYKEMRAEFDDQIGELLTRKARLQKQLFKYTL